jgi:predicted transcriptional regulator
VTVDLDGAVRGLVAIRRAERHGAGVRRELAPARRLLESLTGATVSRSRAARLLGISQTALDRWIDKGEVASVVTPSGRRAVPVRQLVELLDAVANERSRGSRRPLARVIRSRRRAAQALDPGTLLQEGDALGHRPAELRSLAYHRVIADRLDERLVEEARERLGRWRREERIHPRWARAWEEALGRPLPELAELLAADTELARALRQSSPFAGTLNEQERRRIIELASEHEPART